MTFKYDRIDEFVCGIASAKLNGKWGAIDKQGNEVLPFIYDGIEGFQEGGKYLVYFKGEYLYLDVEPR